MEIYKRKTVEKVVGYQCDWCKCECRSNEHATLQATWGYDSNYDLQYHYAHFCPECYERLLKFLKKLKCRINKHWYELAGGGLLGAIKEGPNKKIKKGDKDVRVKSFSKKDKPPHNIDGHDC
jgi:hypothetical protein